MEASDLHETLLDCGILGIRLQHLQDDLKLTVLLVLIGGVVVVTIVVLSLPLLFVIGLICLHFSADTKIQGGP